MSTETHPLEPFLPSHATLLFLGSFPPPKARWSMDFFYPNYINDLSEMAVGMLSYTKQAFGGYLGGEFPFYSSPVWYEERTDFSPRQLGIDRISHTENRGFEVIQGSGCFRGQLLGGCLESLYDVLTKSRYEDEKELCEKYSIFPSVEEWKGKILFIEIQIFGTTSL